MKREEEQVHKYLVAQGYSRIVYEPDGNVPPDFLVETSIAIEVRRLNQYIDVGGGELESIENADYEVWNTFQRITESFSAEHYNHSIFIFPLFQRPIRIKEFRQQIIETLELHLNTPDEDKEYIIADNLNVRLFPASCKLETVYRMGGSSDGDSGGFIVNEIYNVLPHILAEKDSKIAPYKHRYNTWWLALVDTIGYGLDQHDFNQFRQLPARETDFDKVLIVSPLDHTRAVFIIE